MKSVFLKYSMIVVFGLLSSNSAFAAFVCKPNQPNCSNGPTTPPPPHDPTKTTADGYFEVASPNCLEADMELAKLGAQEKAIRDAQFTLRSENVKQTSPFKFLILRCEQSIYAGSFQGNSWIVYVIADYSL